jgi:hypothetical protein
MQHACKRGEKSVARWMNMIVTGTATRAVANLGIVLLLLAHRENVLNLRPLQTDGTATADASARTLFG